MIYCILLLEIGLRVTRTQQTYLEKVNGRYMSMYKYRPHEASHKRNSSDTFLLQSPTEFSYEYHSNSWGYSDKEWSEKKDGKCRIIAFGDSFTEAFGVSQDSTWVAQISRMDVKKREEWLNGGISGSDPFTNFYNLENELYRLKPNVVVQIYSNQDFEEDILLRGTYDRFKNGKLEYEKTPFVEYLYAYSHIYRWVHNSLTGRFFYIPIQKIRNISIDSSFAQLAKLYNDWAQKNEVHVILIFYDTSFHYFKEKKLSIDKSYQTLGNYLTIASVTDCYHEKYLQDTLNYKSLWWSVDGHHNREGYTVMANCIHQIVEPIIDAKFQMDTSSN
ncbi:MAG: hypothetical protein M9958_00655 [Chitinophagales bacterium]|nr:hypothetical protein [Chitinophagales bacterium]